jgi:hypothetical protein
VVITYAKRTAIGRAFKGQYKDIPVDELLHALFKAALADSKLDPSKIDDICVGTLPLWKHQLPAGLNFLKERAIPLLLFTSLGLRHWLLVSPLKFLYPRSTDYALLGSWRFATLRITSRLGKLSLGLQLLLKA